MHTIIWRNKITGVKGCSYILYTNYEHALTISEFADRDVPENEHLVVDC